MCKGGETLYVEGNHVTELKQQVKMGRAPCCSKVGLRRGAWSLGEDKLLTDYILANGEGKWRSLPTNAGLLRCGKSCRLRWMNYLRPGIKRGNMTSDEDQLILHLHSLVGNHWSQIAQHLPGRTDNEIKNHFNTHLRRKLVQQERNSNTNKNSTSQSSYCNSVDSISVSASTTHHFYECDVDDIPSPSGDLDKMYHEYLNLLN